VRLLAYVGGAAVLPIVAAQVIQHRKPISPAPPVAKSQWVDMERMFPAFALAIPETADAPANYAVRRNIAGNGRIDIFPLGETDSVDPYLEVRVYRPGTEIDDFGLPQIVIAEDAADFAPVNVRAPSEPLDGKFGPPDIVTFDTGRGTPRHCLAFVRAWDNPRPAVNSSSAQHLCALDPLTLLSAGSERRISALFAKAELNRSFCGQRDPILAPTPKILPVVEGAGKSPLTACGGHRSPAGRKGGPIRRNHPKKRDFRGTQAFFDLCHVQLSVIWHCSAEPNAGRVQ
jgi:hypothetical protein